MQSENTFLAVLPEADRLRLEQVSRRVHLPQRFSFYRSGDLPAAIYFPESGMASELVRMPDGKTIDGSPVGRDGFIGVPAVMGVSRSFHHCVMQVSGSALRVPIGTVCALFENSLTFRSVTTRFLHARFVQATQSAACSLLHSMDQRLARWLLCTYRHTGSDTFQVTQEYISEMVGANRSTVTITLGALQREGLIGFERGVIRITDTRELSRVSCDCYQVIFAAFDEIRSVIPH